MSNIALKVENISKSFKVRHGQPNSLRKAFVGMFNKKTSLETYEALKNISFEVNKGEFVGIIGKNGAGKSTLLKILSGIYQPDSGSMKVNGKIIPFLELGVGFNHELSARDNVFLNGIILGMTKKDVEAKYDEIIDFAEVRNFQDMPLKNYSSGMQVRLAFSIAIQAKGDILILDEVLAVGDTNFQLKCLDVFKKFKKEKRTIILVSHDQESIRKYCTKIILIDKTTAETYENVDTGIAVYNGISIDSIRESIENKKENKKKSDYSLSEIISDDRWGSKEVLIKDVRILNSSNEQSTLLDHNDDFILEIEIVEVDDGYLEKMQCLNFGLAIYSSTGDYVFGTHTLLSEKVFKPTDKRVRLHFISPKLVSGRYHVNVSVFGEDGKKPFDWVGKAREFEVFGSPRYHGVVALEHVWKNE